MATSGTYTLSKTKTEIIAEAFAILKIGSDGETLTNETGRANNSVNLALKQMQAQAGHLWAATEGTLFLEVGQEQYDFRLSTVHAANTWYETTITNATAANALSFTVTSTTDILDGDVIGIIQNDNNLFWTTVDGTPSSLTVRVDDAIPLSTLSGAFVRNYRAASATSPELIPISRVINVRRQETTDYEIPIIFKSRATYFNLPNKTQKGTPIQAYYSRQDVAGETSGIMYLWSSPISSVPVINFTYERKIQLVLDADDTLDIPDYALEAFAYHLAVRLIPKYGASQAHAMFVRAEADRLMNDMLTFDSELYPIEIEFE
jgi:hypothetical protein